MDNGTASTGTSRSHTSNIVPERLAKKVLVLTHEYLPPSQRIPVLAPTYSLPVRSKCLFKRGDCDSSLCSRRFVTETVSKSPVICVNRLSGLNPVRFSCRCKSYSEFKCEHSLSLWKDWRTLRGEGEFHHRRLAQYYGNTPVCQAGRRGFTPQKRIKKEDAEGAQPPLSTCGFLIKKRTVRFTVIQNL